VKTKSLYLTALLLLSACSLIWSPTATVKKFMSATEKGDVDTMTQLFSSKAVQRLGADTIRSNNQNLADTAKRGAAGGAYRMENFQETAIPDGKQVSFFYKNDKGTDSIKLVFVLSKEGGNWKIDSIGGPESEGIKADVPTTTVPMLPEEVPPPPPPSASGIAQPETKIGLAGKPISGGVLNGKAISLPKPPYPPVARAAKASGTVVVQVVVDENGDVVSARAVSGHPLLQAAAVAAARSAKFSPTKLNGQPAKVSGVITYQFVAE
jgi:TonB family protein